MHIVNIVPGFGGTFYCGNCLRDSGYTSALRETGHESTTLPIYLPLSMDHVARNEDIPVFYGAIGIYLKQQYKLLRAMPTWLEKFFNSPFFLRLAAKRAGSTRAAGLEDMTMSMLKGHEGFQNHELEMLIDYLKNHAKPDVVHLSNALLLGLAKKIKEEIGCAVVCSLQDEDVWIDAMREEYIEDLWNTMAEKAEDVDAFFAVSNYFAELMQKKMRINASKLHVVHVGIEPEKYEFKLPDQDPLVFGYLSRLNEENGFGLVIDAFLTLKKNPEFAKCLLKVTGGSTGDDRKYIKKQVSKLKSAGILKDVEFLEAYEGQEKRDFLNSLSILTVPVLNGEAFGLYQLEAIASGTPIVQPDLGAFPEIVNATGGGSIYSPNTSVALANKLMEVASNRKKLVETAKVGRKSIEENFNMKILINKMINAYEIAINNKS